MSDIQVRGLGTYPTLRRLLVLTLALLAVAVLAVGGSLLTPERTTVQPPRPAAIGRTSSICPVLTEDGADSPPALTVSGVALRPATPRSGALTGAPLGSDAQPELTVDQAGKGATLGRVNGPVVLSGDGGMAGASGGAVVGIGAAGLATGLTAAACLPPETTQWFAGVGSAASDATDLVLTNPDDAQAEVDLRLYGRLGRVAAPGSSGLVIEARSSRTVSLTDAVASDGPLSVAVTANRGRVAADVRRIRTLDLKPAGIDWQLPAASPSTTVTIPAVPGGEGTRELSVINPGTQRATVQVQVLGIAGPYAPAGATSLDLAPESTGTLDLTAGLAGGAGGVRLVSDQPVTGSVLADSTRTGATSDLAVSSAAPALVGVGLSAVATASGVASEMVLSNPSDVDVPLTFDVVSFDGVVLRTDQVLLSPGSSTTRRLISQAPSYLVVSVPAGSAVVGGVTLTQPDGKVAGLATLPLTSPDVAGRAPRVLADPAVGR